MLTYMLRLFAHPAACCCSKYETFQTFNYEQADATTPNIIGPKMLGVGRRQHCWMLHVAPFAHPIACFSVLLGVVVQSLKPVKRLTTSKRTQQLPTLLGQNVTNYCVRLHTLLRVVA